MPVKNLESFIAGLLEKSGNAPDQLLQHLIAVQHSYSHIPALAVSLLARYLHVSEMHVYGVIDFYAFLHRHSRGDFDIQFSDNITDRMLGNKQLFDSLCNRLGVTAGMLRDDGRVTIDRTSCTGICDQGPAMLVNGMAVSRLDEKRIGAIAELVENNRPVTEWPPSFFEVLDNIERSDRLLQRQINHGDAIGKLMANGAEYIIECIEHSGLRGRGGAGFNTALKWRACKNTKADTHYVVCNADEGEPGTFKDRVLLNSYADDVFEGMTLCAGVTGASKGYLYLRGEYRFLLEHLRHCLQQRREAGLLGKNILGKTGFDFDIDIHLGAGAYICGEESALIESLEGKRGIPRNRPPYPVSHGFHQQPTVVNNVETFVSAAKIAVFGAEWFNAAGTRESAGTKLLSISGDCDRPGIYEYPFGVTIKQVLEDCGARDTQAVQVSGAAGATIPSREFGRSLAFEDVPTGGSFMIFNQQRNLLDMVDNFAHFFCHESCGFCTPCRVGGSLLKNLVEKVIDGHATRYDLNEMQNIGRVMQQASHCGLGTTAPNPVLDTLEKFPDIYSNRLALRGYEPAFDLDAALDVSRQVTGRDDEGAHIREES